MFSRSEKERFQELVLADDQGLKRLLDRVRTYLGMDLAYVTQFVEGQHVPVAAEGDVGGLVLGRPVPEHETYCARVLAGELPAVIPQARHDLITRELDATGGIGIAAYASAPIRPRPDEPPIGMLCCISHVERPDLDEQATKILTFTAGLIVDLLEDPETTYRQEHREEAGRVIDLVRQRRARVAFQPLFDLATGRTAGFEALARFDDPRLSTPDVTFSAATRTGQGPLLERLMIELALERLEDIPPGNRLYLNLSPQALLDPDVQRVLQGAADERIGVELTEHEQIADYAEVLQVTQGLQARGVHIAVDDAGAGYSSFRHILRLAPDVIKIDLEITRDVHRDPVRQALARAIIHFARDIGATLVAEGIETPDQFLTLRELGAELGQGYLMCPPSPLDLTRLTAEAWQRSDLAAPG